MDLLIISNYWHFEFEKKSSRYLSIANLATEAGINVEVVTSKFYHTTKHHRSIQKSVLDRYVYKSTLINEPGYKKNIDLRRIFSHKIFADNVVSYLNRRKKPNLIYLFVPTISLGSAVIKYANENNIPIIIDVLDLWPEAFGMLCPFPQLTLKLLSRMRKKADYIYRNANGIIAVSNTYLNRAMSVNQKCQEPIAVYIGIELSVFDNAIKVYSKDKAFIDVVYIGMLGKSYDLKCAIEAISILYQSGITNVRLVIMGDGPLKGEFEQYAKEKQICCEFTGRLPYEEMVNRLVNCDIALNVISRGAVQSIINKHADYLAAGLPVVNNQEIAEFGELINEYNCGINCENNNAVSLANAIKKLVLNESLRKTMGSRARILAEERFNRENTYHEIIRYIKKWQN